MNIVFFTMQFMGKEEQVVVRSQHANVFLGHPSRQKLLTSRWVVVPTQQQQSPIFVLPPKRRMKCPVPYPVLNFFGIKQRKMGMSIFWRCVYLAGPQTTIFHSSSHFAPGKSRTEQCKGATRQSKFGTSRVGGLGANGVSPGCLFQIDSDLTQITSYFK